jgi:hypothetical protein
MRSRALSIDVARENATTTTTTTNKTESTMSINNSEHYIDDLALQLDEDTNGANGELDTKQIRERLMQSIVERCNYSIAGHSGIDEDWIEMSVAEHEHQPALTLSQAASFIMRVWLHKDRQVMEELMSPLPSVEQMSAIINNRLANKETSR